MAIDLSIRQTGPIAQLWTLPSDLITVVIRYIPDRISVGHISRFTPPHHSGGCQLSNVSCGGDRKVLGVHNDEGEYLWAHCVGMNHS